MAAILEPGEGGQESPQDANQSQKTIPKAPIPDILLQEKNIPYSLKSGFPGTYSFMP